LIDYKGTKANFAFVHAAKVYKKFEVYFYIFLSWAPGRVGQPQRPISLPQGREYLVANEY